MGENDMTPNFWYRPQWFCIPRGIYMVPDIISGVKTSIHKHLLWSFSDTSITDKSNGAQTSCYSAAEFPYSYQLNESVFILNPDISL
jgi:hypothetical protein